VISGIIAHSKYTSLAIALIFFILYRPQLLHLLGRLLMKKHLRHLTSCLLLAASFSNAAEYDVTALSRAMDDFIPHVMSQHNTPGLVISLADRKGIFLNRGYGYSDLDARAPMPADAVIKGGSMGKLYTATAILQLADKGIVALDKPVNQYLTGFEIINPIGNRPITIADLLTHRSGLSTNPAGGASLSSPAPLPQHIREAFASDRNEAYYGSLTPRWTARVGEKYQYSNLGIATLGYLVETLNPEGLGFDQYVYQHIMSPLGMEAAQYPPRQDSLSIRPELLARIPTGYTSFERFTVTSPTLLAPEYPAGNGIFTSNDHIRLLLAYLNGGHFNDHQLLSPATAQQAISHQNDRNGDGEIGYVWWLSNPGTERFSFGHPGAIVLEWSSAYRAFPQLDFAYVVATNHWRINQQNYREAALIERFAVDWLLRERAQGKPPEFKSWAWKTSYVAGLLMLEIYNFAGVRDTPDQKTVERISGSGREMVSSNPTPVAFDPTGFQAGFGAGLAIAKTYQALQEFWESDELAVSQVELAIILEQLGQSPRVAN
jgi:CubicO group peptidase (beta-lactamase class C family)